MAAILAFGVLDAGKFREGGIDLLGHVGRQVDAEVDALDLGQRNREFTVAREHLEFIL